MKNIKEKRKKELKKKKIITLIIVIFTIFVTYTIINSPILDIKINETTVNYISFYNDNKTDELTIKNIKKLSTKIGKSKWNKSSLEFKINGKNNKEYEIILIPKDNNINEKYIYYYLKKGKETLSSSIDRLNVSQDSEKILYQGKIDNDNIIIKLWISNKYKDKITNNTFEIIIRPR